MTKPPLDRYAHISLFHGLTKGLVPLFIKTSLADVGTVSSPGYRGRSRGAPGAQTPLTTKNEAPAPKFYKTEAPEWQFQASHDLRLPLIKSWIHPGIILNSFVTVIIHNILISWLREFHYLLWCDCHRISYIQFQLINFQD